MNQPADEAADEAADDMDACPECGASFDESCKAKPITGRCPAMEIYLGVPHHADP
jgi:hypothetical protein